MVSNKYGYSVMECWHIFDKNFKPSTRKPESQGASSHSTHNAQANNKTITNDLTQANAYLAHQDQLHIPQELESQA